MADESKQIPTIDAAAWPDFIAQIKREAWTQLHLFSHPHEEGGVAAYLSTQGLISEHMFCCPSAVLQDVAKCQSLTSLTLASLNVDLAGARELSKLSNLTSLNVIANARVQTLATNRYRLTIIDLTPS